MGSAFELGLREEPVDDRTQVVAPRGEVDLRTAPHLGKRLLSLIDEGKTRLVVDLSRVTFMDSTGIGVLLDALRRLTCRNGGLVLVCPNERVLRPFEVSGLTGYIQIARSRKEALRGLGAFAA
jgi:anti-sigma B factor antagonist